MEKTRTRGKQLTTIQILDSRINSPKLRKELDNLTGVDYINFVIEVSFIINSLRLIYNI